MLDPEHYTSSMEFYYPQDPLELGFKNLSSIETGIDQNTQEKYIKAFLSDKEISPEVLDRVLELNRKYSKQIEGS